MAGFLIFIRNCHKLKSVILQAAMLAKKVFRLEKGCGLFCDSLLERLDFYEHECNDSDYGY